MDGHFITEVAGRDGLVKRVFDGVYCIDVLPATFVPDRLYVVNLAKSTEDFGHFICLSTMDMKPALLCSALTSYGEYRDIKIRFEKFMKTHHIARKVYEFPARLQDPNSTSCGNFALFHLYLLARRMTGSEIFARFYRGKCHPDGLYKLDVLTACATSALYGLKEGTLERFVYNVDFLKGQKEYEKRIGPGP